MKDKNTGNERYITLKLNMAKISILEYLKRQLEGTLTPDMKTSMNYPTKISDTLKMEIVAVARGTASVVINADASVYGNQQGTVHGGLISELADAAMGTAHSTLMNDDSSFTTVELKINFYRPVWRSILQASARPLHSGKTIAHYICEVSNEEGKIVAVATSTIMNLYNDKALGR